jgi:hypothetical protein
MCHTVCANATCVSTGTASRSARNGPRLPSSRPPHPERTPTPSPAPDPPPLRSFFPAAYSPAPPASARHRTAHRHPIAPEPYARTRFAHSTWGRVNHPRRRSARVPSTRRLRKPQSGPRARYSRCCWYPPLRVEYSRGAWPPPPAGVARTGQRARGGGCRGTALHCTALFQGLGKAEHRSYPVQALSVRYHPCPRDAALRCSCV